MTRLQEVDALRAFALLGIALANYPILAQSAQSLLSPAPTVAGQLITAALEMFVSAKFFVLFSFLFGWGMGVQIASAGRRGVAARGPFLRRLAGLGAIGVAHALLVFHGDILVFYAVLGLVLWALRDAPPRRLVQIALVAVVVAIPAYIALGYSVAKGLAALPPDPVGAGYLGGFGEATAQRARDWPPALWFVLLFNGPLALSAFCAGLAAQKAGLFDPGSAQWGRLCCAVPWLVAVGLATNLTHMVAFGAILDGTQAPLVASLGFAALGLGAPTLGLVYLWAVVEAARRWGVPAWMAAAGGMSATIYVGQGVLGGLVFNGYGLGLYDSLSPPLVALVACGATVLLFAAAALWARAFGQGPLERLLRAVTRGGPSQPSA
ncbi:MAG: DUF418 domain-containing protein [Pseudorhodobacter sp.]